MLNQRMKNFQACASKTQLQRAQNHQNKGSDVDVDNVLSPSCSQSEAVSAKVGTLKDRNYDFVEMITPKKNDQTRSSTECHVIKFIPCFMKMLNERITDDLIYDDENSEEEEEGGGGGTV
uniref:Uncharacterized protein n=1 Tax=Ditylum brightwellii TaxID=49249 RepID=A0A7S1YUH3_9STRA|mmetsp:Transcript_17687/g.26379  ORF Transcript_17687/g.26379 Transcript_17687/m.26379 type:complete len:120 (+) Transcript_17687:115-474(+)